MKDSFDVHEVAWNQHREAIRQFRIGVSVGGATPETRRIARPNINEAKLDAARSTRHVCAFDAGSGVLAGTLRMHQAKAANTLPGPIQNLGDAFKFAYISAYFIDDAYRHTNAKGLLLEVAYRRARSLGFDAFVADAVPHRVMMYEGLGFVRCGEGYTSADRGFVVPMLMNLQDGAHLRRCGSRLAEVAARYLNPDLLGPQLVQVLGEKRRRGRRLTVPTDAGQNETSPALPQSLLRQLDEFVLSGLLERSIRQKVPCGTQINRPDSADIIAIIKGTAGIVPEGGRFPVAYLQAGDVVAEPALAADQLKGRFKVTALSECTLITLNEGDLERIMDGDPMLGAQLMYKLLGGVTQRLARMTRMLLGDSASPTSRRLERPASAAKALGTLVAVAH